MDEIQKAIEALRLEGAFGEGGLYEQTDTKRGLW